MPKSDVLMSAWRRIAIEKLPKLRRMIDRSESIGSLWIDLWDEFVKAHRDPIDEQTIEAVYEFAWWAVGDANNDDVASATLTGFFEDIPTDRRVCELLPQFMTRNEFLGMTEIFKYMLSGEAHAEFVRDFLKRREAMERSRDRPVDNNK